MMQILSLVGYIVLLYMLATLVEVILELIFDDR